MSESTEIISKHQLPQSCVGWWDPFVGLVAASLAFYGLQFWSSPSTSALAFATVVSTIVALATVEILRAPWCRSRPLSRPIFDCVQTAAIDTLGLLGGIALALFLYWAFPEYHLPHYEPFFTTLGKIIPLLPPLAFIYFFFAEWRLPPCREGPWQVGILILGAWRQIEWKLLRQYILFCLVVAFFLPIMSIELINGIDRFRALLQTGIANSFLKFYAIAFVAIFTFELIFVTAGYIAACRLLNTQVRSTDESLLGWTSALICYDPFVLLVFTRYLDYHGHIAWTAWLNNNPFLTVFWGSAILILMILHFWSDACFGLHFSNLTHRGIITNGPYRFCRHPAYLCKNLRWWMVSVPFVAGSTWLESLRLSILLIGVNLVYAVRAYTEEKHLSKDPLYVAYALWIDEHGVFRFAGRIIPALSYSYRSKIWP